MVLVDSEVILKAPVRFLAAGMGDALSTWYEARSNFESRSNNYIADGYAVTIAGAQIARACLHRSTVIPAATPLPPSPPGVVA